MGLPVTERGGPPGGGGTGRPDALVGGCTGADGGVAGAARLGAGGRGGAVGAGRGGTPSAGGVRGGRLGAGAVAAGALGTAGAGGAAGAGATGAAGGGGAVEMAGGAEAGRGGGTRGATDGWGRGVGGGVCSEAGRLVTSRAPVRLMGPEVAAAGETGSGTSIDGAEGPRSGAGWAATGSAGTVATALLTGAAFLAGGSGSSGCTGRRRPSRSAFLRARSACASSMDDEWLFTPIPRDRQRSSASLLVRPSS